MELLLGLLLQIVGCAFSATGLAFMKWSSEIDGDVLMILRWRWWLGFAFLGIFATVVEGAVLTLVPLTIVAPFAGLTILISMLIAASGCISERVPIGPVQASGGALTVLGVGLVSFFGPNDASAEASLTFASVIAALSNPQFFLFIVSTLISVAAWLAVYLAPPLGTWQPVLRRLRALADEANLSTACSAYAAAVCGALSQTFLKCVSVAIGHSLSLPGVSAALREVWLQPPMWGALGGLVVCAPLQLYLIDVCLSSGAVTYAVPLYQALLVTLEIMAAAIFFRELAHQTTGDLLCFGVGVGVATAGLVVLSWATRDDDATGGKPPREQQQQQQGPQQSYVPPTIGLRPESPWSPRGSGAGYHQPDSAYMV